MVQPQIYFSGFVRQDPNTQHDKRVQWEDEGVYDHKNMGNQADDAQAKGKIKKFCPSAVMRIKIIERNGAGGFVFAKKYKWTDWKEKLSGRILPKEEVIDEGVL